MRYESNLMTVEELERVFMLAYANDQQVYVELKMKGFKGNELIVNPPENILPKLEYYKKTYDEKLRHKHANIRMVAFGII